MATTPTPENLQYQLTHKDEDRGPLIKTVSIVLIVIATVLVILRFLARWIRRLKLQIDDYFMIPALLFTIVLCVENIISVRFGNGKHTVAVGLENSEKLIELIYFLSVTYAVVHFFVKMSILFLYRRIFTTLDRTFRISLYITMAYVICWSIATLLVTILQCVPASKYWHRYDPSYAGECGVDLASASIGINAFSIVADFALLALPFIILTKLQLTQRRKIELAAIFSVGLFACAASVVRIYTMYSESTTPSLKMDPTFNTSDVLIWTAIEPTVGIVCACFPVVLPAFTRKALVARFPTRRLNSFDSSGGGAFVQRLAMKISGSMSSGSGSDSKGSRNGSGRTAGVSNGSKGSRTWWRSQATTTAASHDSGLVKEEEEENWQGGLEKNGNVFASEMVVLRNGSAESGDKRGASASSLEEGMAVRPSYWGTLGREVDRGDGIVVTTDLHWAGERADRPSGGVAS